MNDTPTKRERRRRKKEAQRKAKRAGQDALAALEQAVRLFAGVAGETGVPGLQSGVASLVSVIDMIKVCPRVCIASELRSDGRLYSNRRRTSKTLRGWTPGSAS